MAEDLWQTLTRFHREIAMPDIEQKIKEPLERRIDDLRDEMHSHLDAIWKELRDLKQEYYAITAGLKRLEEKVDSIVRGELKELKERVVALEQRLSDLEARASRGTRV